MILAVFYSCIPVIHILWAVTLSRILDSITNRILLQISQDVNPFCCKNLRCDLLLIIVKIITKLKRTSGQTILTTGRIAWGFSLRKCCVTLDCVCGQPVTSLVDSMWANLESGPLGMAHCGVRENPDVIPSQLTLHGGIWTPSDTWFLGPTRVNNRMTSLSVKPLLLGSQSWPRDHTTLYVARDCV